MPLKNLIGRAVLPLLPLHALPAVNRFLLRFMGHNIAPGVVFYSSSQIIGGVKATIGENSFVGHQTLIMGGISTVVIGKDCDISSRVNIITGTHHIASSARRAGEGYSRNIVIGDGVWVGFGVTIMGGVTVGSGSIVAAGSFVNKNVPPNTIVAGVPAKVIRTLE